MQEYRHIKVGAFNGPKAEVTSADFRCDGIADDVEINEAMRLAGGTIGSLLCSKRTEKWFQEVCTFLSVRYSQVEDRMENTFKFVTITKEHGSVYSYEFSGVLKDAASALASALDTLIRNIEVVPEIWTGG